MPQPLVALDPMRAANPKSLSIDLGLAVAAAVKPYGARYSQNDIADICECSRNVIFETEQRALWKLRVRLAAVLKEMDQTFSPFRWQPKRSRPEARP